MKIAALLLILLSVACTGREAADLTLGVLGETAGEVIDTEIYKHTQALDEAFDNALGEVDEKINEIDREIGIGYIDPQDYPRNGYDGTIDEILSGLNHSVGYTPDSNFSGVYYVLEKPTAPWQIAVSETSDGSGVQLASYGEDLHHPLRTRIVPYQ